MNSFFDVVASLTFLCWMFCLEDLGDEEEEDDSDTNVGQ